MGSNQDLEQREAPQGEKIIEIRIRFWTNDIAESPHSSLTNTNFTLSMFRLKK
jgi:hypothetical protein